MSARKLEAEHRRIQREVLASRRKDARARVKQLRADLKRAREERKQRMQAVRQQCRDARARLRVRIEQQRRELKAAIAAERYAQRHQCQASRDATREQALAKVQGLATSLHRATLLRSELARATRGTRKAADVHVTAAERKQESDDAVRRELPRELVPVFNAVRREIHASPRASRAEVFLQWAHDHPARVLEIQAGDVERWIRDMEREERALMRGEIAVPRAKRPEASAAADEWGG